jgi:FkbM family methyltransferase
MKTAQKIQIAKVAYLTVRTARWLVGQNDHCIVTRAGIRYELDLSQGIDFAIYIQRSFEPATRRALRRHVTPGSTVIDIGANVGAHTVTLAKFVGENGHVLAFEPTTFAYKKLMRNLELNGELKKRVTSYQCFLGPMDAMPVPSSVYSSWPLFECSALHPKHLGQAMSTSHATSHSLDSIWLKHGCPLIQLVKMDVDGYECVVLAGARNMMARNCPIFIMELAPHVLQEQRASLKELLCFFLPLGYRFFDLRTEDELPQDERGLTNLVGDGASINIMARVC